MFCFDDFSLEAHTLNRLDAPIRPGHKLQQYRQLLSGNSLCFKKRSLIVVWDLCIFFLQVKTRNVFSDLLPAVDEFVKEQTIKYYDDVSAELIHKTRNGDIDVEEVIRAWEKAFREVLCTAFNS